MADIIIQVAAKIFISFSPISVNMIREQANSIPATLNYTLGTGQVIAPNTTLTFTGGGQTVNLNFPTGGTINGTGSIDVIVISTPTATAVDAPATFTFDGSIITVNIDYNSNPVASDINISMDNRTTHDFTISEVELSYFDYDADMLASIRIDNDTNGNVTGYEFNIGTVGSPNYQPYVANTPIVRADIPKLRYVALNQNPAYTKANPWYATDIHGNESQ